MSVILADGCWLILLQCHLLTTSHHLCSQFLTDQQLKSDCCKFCVCCVCLQVLVLVIISFQQRRDLSCTPGSVVDLSTNYRLSVDFHGSGWSNKRKGFHFPDHEIFTVKSLFLKRYICMIGACVSGVLEWCSAVFTMKLTHESAILLRTWILNCCSFWCTRKLHGGLEQMNFSPTRGKAVGWQRCIWTD